MPTVAIFAEIFDSERRILCVKRGYGPRTWTLPAAGGFFAKDRLPEPLSPRARQHTEDALVGRTRVAHVFEPE